MFLQAPRFIRVWRVAVRPVAALRTTVPRATGPHRPHVVQAKKKRGKISREGGAPEYTYGSLDKTAVNKKKEHQLTSASAASVGDGRREGAMGM
jgi:hypothetical protein